MQLGFICEKLNSNDTSLLSNFVQPLSFGDGNICPIGYSTFGGILFFNLIILKSIQKQNREFINCLFIIVTTTGGSANSDPCIFPFRYKGEIYYECITKDRTTPW